VSDQFFEHGTRLLTPNAFDFVLDGELKQAVRSQNFLTLLVLEARREWDGMTVTADPGTVGEVAQILGLEVRHTDLIGMAQNGTLSIALLDADFENSQKVIDREVVSKITVTDQQVTDYFNANKSQFNIAEEAYHIAQIVVTPARDTQVNNGTGDDAATPQAAAAKVQMLMERLKAGASFSELAMGYSEDPESAPRGGDLGFVPISRLRQAPAPLRDAVLNKTPGSVNVATAGGVYTVVLVVAHENAGQRDLSTPAVRDRIVETLRGRRAQLVRAAYLTAIRANAKVENHLARRVVDAQGKVQGVAPLAP